MKDLIRSNKPREAIIQKMLIQEQISGSGGVGVHRDNALAQSVSVRANKFDVLHRKAGDTIHDHIQQDFE